MNIRVVGLDLAKHYFQVFVLSDENKVISNKKATRTKLSDVGVNFLNIHLLLWWPVAAQIIGLEQLNYKTLSRYAALDKG